MFSSDMRNRLARIENLLGIQDIDPQSDEFIASTAPFRARVDVVLHWDQILSTLVPDAQARGALVQDFRAMSEARKGEDDLLGERPLLDTEGFVFHWFRMPACPYDLIWSYGHRGFVRKLEVIGKIFGMLYTLWVTITPTAEKSTQEIDAVRHYLRIAPGKLSLEDGYNYSYYSGPVGGPKVTIAELPFDEIVSLLVSICRVGGSHARHAIAEFPAEITDKLKLAGFEYELEGLGQEDYHTGARFAYERLNDAFNETAWARTIGVRLYNSLVRFHVFKSKWYTVSLDIEVF